MKVGFLVKNKLKLPECPVGIVIEVKEDLFVEDVHCNRWGFPDQIRVLYPGGEIEVNPADLYEIVSKNN